MAKLNVKKANHLIPLEERISKAAQLWVSFLIANLPRSTEEPGEFPALTFSFRDVKRAINADGKRRITVSEELKNIHKELISTPLWYEDEEQADMVAWLTRVRWDKRENIFTYYFHPALKPYLIDVKEHYTLYNYYYRVCLSAHSMKFYEILKMYQYLGKVALDLEGDVKFPLGLAGKYKDYYNFRRRVLNPIQEELQAFTDIRFEYKPHEKDGKRIVSLLFFIEKNAPENLPRSLQDAVRDQGISFDEQALPEGTAGKKEEEAEEKELSELPPEIYIQLKAWGGQDNSIQTILSRHGIAAISYQVNHLSRIIKQGKRPVANPFAWLLKALQNNYIDAMQQQQRDVKAKIAARKKQVSQKEEMKATLKMLEQEYHDKMRQTCRVLLKKQPHILKEAVELLRDSLFIRRAFQKGKSPEEMYKDKMLTWTIQTQIHEDYPVHFQALKENYLPKIKRLKALLLRM